MEVQVIGQSGFVWNQNDALKLRKNHRILGNFVGFTPKTYEIGLPLVLLPEEMQLLVEKNLIKLVVVKDIKSKPKDALIQRALEYKEKMYQTQIEEFKSERIERIKRMADKIVEGKRKKIVQSGDIKKKAKLNENVDKSSDTVEEEAIISKAEEEAIISKEISNIRPITRDMQVIQTFEEDPWLQEEDKEDSDWRFNYSNRSKCRLFTFKDLWNHNYLLTEGSKFGGDFLVYCGDPSMYHAKYVVICLEEKAELGIDGRVQDLVARSRLGSSVKKIILFSWLEGEDVKYKSLTRGSAV